MTAITRMAATLATLLLSCHTKKMPFGFHPEPGKIVEISILKESSFRQDTFSRADTTRLQLSMETIKVANGYSNLKLTFRKIELTRPNQFLSMLHADVDWQAFLRLFNGYSFYAGIDNTGAIQHLTYDGNMIDSIARIAQLDKYTVKGLTHDYIGADALKDLLNRFFSCTPGSVVSTGSNWQETFFLTTKAPIKVNSLYTLKEIKEDTVLLDMQGIISARTGEGSTLYLEGSQTGKLSVSCTTGIPYRYELTAASVYTTPYYKIQYNDHFIFTR
jgi:hypothetical protein